MALGKTRNELLESLDVYELQEWRIFWQMEGGFGDWKQDYRTGQICQILANVNRDSKKQRTPFNLEDFALRPKKKGLTPNKQKYIRQQLDALATPKKDIKDGKSN